MRWSRSAKRIFDGGAVGRDAVSVFRGNADGNGQLHVFAFEDAVTGAASPSVSTPTSSAASKTPASSEASPSPAPVPLPTTSGIDPAEADRREQLAFERGQQEGQKAADERLERLAEQLEGAMLFLHETATKLDERASRQALELGLMVAERLFRKSVEVDPDQLIAAAQELIDAADDQGPLRIVVDPITAKHWRNHSDALSEMLPERPFEVESKADLSVGDLIVHSGDQTLDERVHNRLQQYTHALEQELGLSSAD